MMSSDARFTSFNQYNHGSVGIQYSKIRGSKRQFLEKVLRFGWGIPTTESIMRVAQGEGSSTRNYRVESGGKAFLLKEAKMDKPYLRDLANKCILFCEGRGARVPHVISTQRKQNFYGVSRIVSLYNFLGGEHFDGSRKELRAAAINLALLDQILSTIPRRDEICQGMGYRVQYDHGSAKALLKSVRRRGSRDEFDAQVAAELDLLFEKVDETGSAKMHALPMQEIHLNVHPHNLIFSSQSKGLLAILDFESIKYSQRAREVAFAMHRLSRAYGEHMEGKEDLGADIRERAREFLSAYTSANPLTDEEIKSLGIILSEENLSRVLTVLRNHYERYDSRKDSRFQKRMQMLKESELFYSL